MDQKNSRLVFGIALVLLAGVIALAIGRPDLTASELGTLVLALGLTIERISG